MPPAAPGTDGGALRFAGSCGPAGAGAAEEPNPLGPCRSGRPGETEPDPLAGGGDEENGGGLMTRRQFVDTRRRKLIARGHPEVVVVILDEVRRGISRVPSARVVDEQEVLAVDPDVIRAHVFQRHRDLDERRVISDRARVGGSPHLDGEMPGWIGPLGGQDSDGGEPHGHRRLRRTSDEPWRHQSAHPADATASLPVGRRRDVPLLPFTPARIFYAPRRARPDARGADRSRRAGASQLRASAAVSR